MDVKIGYLCYCLPAPTGLPADLSPNWTPEAAVVEISQYQQLEKTHISPDSDVLCLD